MSFKGVAASLTFMVIVSITLCLPKSVTIGEASFPQQSAERDRQALIDLENVWLTANDAPTLERILAGQIKSRAFSVMAVRC